MRHLIFDALSERRCLVFAGLGCRFVGYARAARLREWGLELLQYGTGLAIDASAWTFLSEQSERMIRRQRLKGGNI
jgi:hypothetical protein